MSRVALPELRRLSYQEGLSKGALAAGGALGILIPPSVALVIYAIVVEAPIILIVLVCVAILITLPVLSLYLPRIL